MPLQTCYFSRGGSCMARCIVLVFVPHLWPRRKNRFLRVYARCRHLLRLFFKRRYNGSRAKARHCVRHKKRDTDWTIDCVRNRSQRRNLRARTSLRISPLIVAECGTEFLPVKASSLKRLRTSLQNYALVEYGKPLAARSPGVPVAIKDVLSTR